MKYRLGDLLYIKGRIGWKGLKKKEYLDKGDYRIINGTNIINGKVNWSSCGFISKERYNESPEIMLKANDILITKDGTIGKVAIVEELSKPSTVASGIFILRNTSPNIWITKYLYYYLQSYDFKSFIHSRIEGSVIPHLYQKDFESLSIKSPSLEEQNTISKRLELIDKKIDLNNQLNDNLTQISLLNLANMIKNKSYEIRKISDLDIIISDHVANGSFKALKENVTYYDENNYALFLRNIDFKNRLDGANRYIDKESYNYLKKSHLFGGEVVISNVADVGTIHRVPFINRPMVIGNNQIFIKSVHSFLTEYLYVYFKSYWGQNSIFSITSGSAQQKFNKTDFRALEIPIPSPNWILTNIRPFILAKDKIFNETKSLEQLKKNLLNNYF
ncbi:restriction endonuclease subunit S [Limosilactobacillus reuteri]|uniref:restriction endonuclease subunit S n=2 Tax=Limosilactobacillus reuteri TaxID=1598 RepID=UPI00115C2A94|nr:restriction endonuclease subunit S [Limosilactobacillus reuteri]VTZ91329.1 hypothetical protein LREP572_01257 [Limosilactobacillus reuteri]